MKKQSPQTFQCNICGVQLESIGLFNAHKENHVEKNFQYDCNLCDEELNNQAEFDKHMKHWHNYMDNLNEHDYNCNDCVFQGGNIGDFKKHLNVTHHTSSVEFIYKCNICKQNFTSKLNLMTHRKEVHPDKIKDCRFFKENTCVFDENACWYGHVVDVNTTNSVKSCVEAVSYTHLTLPTILLV